MFLKEVASAGQGNYLIKKAVKILQFEVTIFREYIVNCNLFL